MNRVCYVLAFVIGGAMLDSPEFVTADVCVNPIPQSVIQQVAYPLNIPLYGATYQSTGPSPTTQTTDDLLRELVEQQKTIIALLSSGKDSGGGASVLSINPKPAMVKNCAGCHTEGKLKNTDFIMFDTKGELRKFSSPDRKEIRMLVDKNKMPPTGKLTAEDKDVILKSFTK